MSKRTIVAPEASKRFQSTEMGNQLQEKIQDIETPAHRSALAKQIRRNEFVTLADQVAENTFYFRNHKFKEANQVYPGELDFDMRIVTKMYPFAKGGELLVDEPQNEREMLMAYEKHKKLKALGYRHVVIEQDATLSDILEQLGEL